VLSLLPVLMAAQLLIVEAMRALKTAKMEKVVVSRWGMDLLPAVQRQHLPQSPSSLRIRSTPPKAPSHPAWAPTPLSWVLPAPGACWEVLGVSFRVQDKCQCRGAFVPCLLLPGLRAPSWAI
jgi:hypothetical protein